jgi:hypothetical protein
MRPANCRDLDAESRGQIDLVFLLLHQDVSDHPL